MKEVSKFLPLFSVYVNRTSSIYGHSFKQYKKVFRQQEYLKLIL